MSLPDSHRVNLHLLAPIHIGTGQELEPFDYVIRDNALFFIDLVKWMASFSQQEQLYQMMESDNFARIRSFIATHFDDPDAVRAAVPIDNPKLIDTYQKALQEQNPANQVLISPMVRNEVNMRCFIPGSSVKGAIRTAITNRFVKTARVSSSDIFNYNKKIFGPPHKDPMRNLKLADVSLGNNGAVIVEAKEFPLNPDKQPTPKGNYEVTLSLCQTGKPVIHSLPFRLSPFSLHGQKIDAPFIIDALYDFYVPKYVSEYTKFYQRAKDVRNGIALINQAVACLRTNETLIRIGHFSHVECVTLDGVRKPKTRLGRDRKPLPWGMTRTLANGIYPFGWAKLEFPDWPSDPRPKKEWPFQSDGAETRPENQEAGKQFATPPIFTAEKPVEPTSPPQTQKQSDDHIRKPIKPAPPKLSPLEKLLQQLNLINATDMGRLGTIIQEIETLETASEKAAVAKAIREKISAKAFKKHKRKAYLLDLIEQGE